MSTNNHAPVVELNTVKKEDFVCAVCGRVGSLSDICVNPLLCNNITEDTIGMISAYEKLRDHVPLHAMRLSNVVQALNTNHIPDDIFADIEAFVDDGVHMRLQKDVKESL